MCGRYTLKTPAQQWLPLFDLPVDAFGDNIPSLRYNVAPTQTVSIVRANSDGSRSAAIVRWGLIPFWAKDGSSASRMINARSETLAEKPAFRAAYKSRRCLVIADGFFEWKASGKSKQPYYFHFDDYRPFGFAGLWESWDKGEGPLETCTIITTSANGQMQSFHDRMPVILNPKHYDLWLDASFYDPAVLSSMLIPLAHDQLDATPVSTAVNSPKNDRRECIEPFSVN